LARLELPMGAEPNRTEPEPGQPQPPKLEFKPDFAKVSRIRLFRVVTFGLALVVLAFGLVWLIAFRPRGPVPAAVSEPEPVGEEAGAQPAPPAVVAAPPAEKTGPGVRDAVAGLESLLGEAQEKWRRAEAFVPLSVPEKGQLEEAVARVRRAVALAESAATVVGRGEARLAELKQALRRAGAGGYRASVLSATADELVREVQGDARDRLEHFRAQEQAYAALARGDSAEFEIKGDVATGYLRKAESRQRRIERTQERLRVALFELER